MPKGKSRRARYVENITNFNIIIPWDDFVYILTRHFGFEMDKKTGSSARTFTLGNETFNAYEPHGSRKREKNVHRSDRKRAIEALKRLDLLEEE